MTMSTATFTFPDGRTLTVERTTVDASTMGGEQRDPEWTFTDSNGHQHQPTVSESGHITAYPTLRYVVDEEDYTDDDGEEYPGSGHWECAACSDEITPGTKYVAGGPAFIPGTTSYLLDGQPITQAEAQALIDDTKQA